MFPAQAIYAGDLNDKRAGPPSLEAKCSSFTSLSTYQNPVWWDLDLITVLQQRNLIPLCNCRSESYVQISQRLYHMM